MGSLFLGVKIIGGLYLMYLGAKIFQGVQYQKHLQPTGGQNRFQTVMSGLLLTLGNPKPILFYASVLPTIIDFNEVKLLDVLIMMMLIAIVSFSVLGAYCYIASLSKKVSTNTRWHKRIHQTAGLVMVAVGVIVITK